MSNINNEQLLTELTAEQASVIEGGYTLNLYSLLCRRDGADTFSQDDVYAQVDIDGISTRYNVGGMSSGNAKYLGWEFNFAESATVSFFDSDWPDSDDYLGGFSAYGPTGLQRANVSGSGSRYTVAYDVYA